MKKLVVVAVGCSMSPVDPIPTSTFGEDSDFPFLRDSNSSRPTLSSLSVGSTHHRASKVLRAFLVLLLMEVLDKLIVHGERVGTSNSPLEDYNAQGYDTYEYEEYSDKAGHDNGNDYVRVEERFWRKGKVKVITLVLIEFLFKRKSIITGTDNRLSITTLHLL